jgi:hypothetical protein
MFCSSDSGQTEPLAALVAVAAVGIGLSLYAGVLDDAIADTSDREIAEPTLDRVERVLASDGVADPEVLTEAVASGPAGYRINLTLGTTRHRWTAGPTPDNDVVDRAERPASVRVGPADVRPGTIQVVVLR